MQHSAGKIFSRDPYDASTRSSSPLFSALSPGSPACLQEHRSSQYQAEGNDSQAYDISSEDEIVEVGTRKTVKQRSPSNPSLAKGADAMERRGQAKPKGK